MIQMSTDDFKELVNELAEDKDICNNQLCCNDIKMLEKVNYDEDKVCNLYWNKRLKRIIEVI